MMFIMHFSSLFALSVLLASTALIIWSFRSKGKGTTFGIAVGSVVFALSILALICISYYGLKYWAQGNFETPTSMSMQMGNTMMQKTSNQMGQMGSMNMHKLGKPRHTSQ